MLFSKRLQLMDEGDGVGRGAGMPHMFRKDDGCLVASPHALAKVHHLPKG